MYSGPVREVLHAIEPLIQINLLNLFRYRNRVRPDWLRDSLGGLAFDPRNGIPNGRTHWRAFLSQRGAFKSIP